MPRFLKDPFNAFKYARWLTPERLLRWGAACALLSLGLLVLYATERADFTSAAGERVGNDFFDYWSGMVLAASGHSAEAYVVGPHHPLDQALTYPPTMMLLCWPLGSLSFAHALMVWVLLGVTLCAWSLSLLVGWEMAVLATIGTPAAFLNAFAVQNGYFTAALLVWGLTLVKRRPVSAGILLGMLCYKPQMGILLPVALAAGRCWRTFVAAAACVFLLVLASLLLFGPEVWSAFYERLALQRWLMEVRAGAWPWMPTVFVSLRLAGSSLLTAYLIQGISTVAAAAAIAVLWHGRGTLAVKSAGLVVATFLATPYAWDYDMVVLVFAAAWLGNAGVATGFRSWEKITAFLLLTLPALSFLPARLVEVQIAPILLWLALAVVLRRGLAVARSGLPAAAAAALGHGGRVPI